MPRRLLFALLALVAAPLVLLGWVSATSMRDQRELAARQLRGLLTSRLTEIDRSLGTLFDGYARSLADAVDKPGRLAENLRELQLTNPLVRQGILVSANGVLTYPAKPVADDPDDIALYAALSGLIDSRPQGIDAGEDTDLAAPTKSPPTESKTKSSELLSRSKRGSVSKTEPMPLAKGVAASDVASVRPAASAVSSKTKQTRCHPGRQQRHPSLADVVPGRRLAVNPLD